MAQQGQPLHFTLPFFPGEDGQNRPYLVLDLHGPEQIYRLRGLVDSGADLSVLPLAYASLLGYSVTDLERVEGQQVQGKLDFWRARRPLTAAITGLSEIPFELQPSFLDGTSSVLWGRQDFMTHWDFLLRQPENEFTLVWRQ